LENEKRTGTLTAQEVVAAADGLEGYSSWWNNVARKDTLFDAYMKTAWKPAEVTLEYLGEVKYAFKKVGETMRRNSPLNPKQIFVMGLVYEAVTGWGKGHEDLGWNTKLLNELKDVLTVLEIPETEMGAETPFMTVQEWDGVISRLKDPVKVNAYQAMIDAAYYRKVNQIDVGQVILKAAAGLFGAVGTGVKEVSKQTRKSFN
jgi:hypothetical protein